MSGSSERFEEEARWIRKSAKSALGAISPFDNRLYRGPSCLVDEKAGPRRLSWVFLVGPDGAVDALAGVLWSGW
jgi:hypothetical protein